MDVSVIIVNYKVRYFLEQCLRSLLAATRDFSVEIIVIDNHSADGSLEYLLPKFNEVRFIALKENRGFGAASNLGVRESKGRYILFLNPDTLVPEDLFAHSLAFFADHPEVGALGYRMINGKGCYLPESKRGFPGVWASFCRLSGLTALFPTSKSFARYYLGHLPEKQTAIVDVLSGAALMIRAEVLQQAGSFDEAFFMYGEDIDLCYRIQLAGYHNYYLPRVTLLHFKGESTERNSAYYQRFFGAMNLFVQKYRRKRFSVLASTIVALCTRVLPHLSFRNSTHQALPPEHPLDYEIIGSAAGPFPHTPGSRNLLFCPGLNYSYKNCIADIELMGQRRSCYICGYGTQSIVGASGWNRKGVSFQVTPG